MSAADTSSLDWSSFWYTMGAWCVVIGILFEGTEIVARKLAKGKARRFIGPLQHPLPEPTTPDWVKNIGDIGFIILFTALVLEQVCHQRMERITERERNRLTKELEVTTVRVEELRKQNLELERQIQPRRITKEQEAEIIRNVEQRHLRQKCAVCLTVDATDAEARILTIQIGNILRKCGFSVSEIPVLSLASKATQPNFGLSILMTDPPPPGAEAISTALLRTLFQATVEKGTARARSGILDIEVHSKPLSD